MSIQTIRATRDYVSVEVRIGNTFDPEASQEVRSGPMQAGDVYPKECVFLYYRREGNPGVPDSGWTFWNQVSLGATVDIQ